MNAAVNLLKALQNGALISYLIHFFFFVIFLTFLQIQNIPATEYVSSPSFSLEIFEFFIFKTIYLCISLIENIFLIVKDSVLIAFFMDPQVLYPSVSLFNIIAEGHLRTLRTLLI